MSSASRRLLFVCSSAHRLGGLATWLDYLLPGLASRGWEPVLGLVEGPRYNRPQRFLADHPHERWVAISCRTGTPEGRCRAVRRAIASLDPALVVAVNIPDALSSVARARTSGGSPRAVMALHGLEPDLWEDVGRFRSVLDGVAATNRLSCRLLEIRSGLESRRIFYVPCGTRFNGPGSANREPRDVLRIGYVGRLEQAQKRVLDIPLVSRALEERGVAHEFLVAGSGPEEGALREAMAGRPAVFLGTVPHEDLGHSVFRNIDVLLVASRSETGPLVAWEAMAAGVPVVSSRYVGSGLEDALRHDDTALLYPVGKPARAAAELARFREDRGLAERLRAGGYRLLAERYTLEASIDGWSRCLESVLALPARPRAPAPEVPPATGRLERLLSPRLAETVRSALRRRGPDSGAGGEWPHTYGSGSHAEEFLRIASDVDREGHPL